jgi:hypothetical protein
MVLSVIFNIIMAIAIYLLTQNIIGAVLMLVFALIYAYFLYSWRFRIPFAKVMLKTVTSITKRYPALFFIGVIGLILDVVFSGIWLLTVVGLMNSKQALNLSDNAVYAIFVYIIFVFYWTSQVISNAIHITTSGLFATFYFKGVDNGRGDIDVPVSNPTSASLKRALTTGLGPNCYGSLLIAIIETIKALVNMSRNDPDNDNIACQILLCCVSCILSIFQDLLEYFNKYGNLHLI